MSISVEGLEGGIYFYSIQSEQGTVQQGKVVKHSCSSANHCLALECELNHTEHEHLVHMFDMYNDEPADDTAIKQWGKDTVVDCLVEIARQITLSLEGQKPPTT